MANPFGSSDEALSKNTGHTNQANLIYAFIPRSTSKWVEVINAATFNPSAGTYDADGYWYAASSTRIDIASTISNRDVKTATTIIAGATYRSGGDVNQTPGQFTGFWDNATDLNRLTIRWDRYARQAKGNMQESGSDSGIAASFYNPGADVSAFAMKTDGTSTNTALYRVSGSSTAAGTGNPGTLTGGYFCDRVGVRIGTKWAYQYMFVYNTSLSDANINSIIDDPGAVISVASGGTVAISGSAATGGHGIQVPNFSIPL